MKVALKKSHKHCSQKFGAERRQTVIDGITVEIPSQPAGLTLDDIIYINDLERREIQMTAGEIDDVFADSFTRLIYHYNCEDKGKVVESRKPIILFIDSPGGSVTAGTTIIDAMKMSKTPIYTVVIGTAYSMALHVAVSGDKRFSLPGATYLLHDGSEGCFDSSSKAHDRMQFTDELGAKLRDGILKKTKITPEVYEKNERREWYMFADKAKELGLIDEILTSFDDIMSCSSESDANKSIAPMIP